MNEKESPENNSENLVIDEALDDEFNKLLKEEATAVRREKMKLSEARKVLDILIKEGKLNRNDKLFQVRHFIENEYGMVADISRGIVEKSSDKEFQGLIESEGWNVAREKIEWNSVRDILDWLVKEKLVVSDDKLSDILDVIDEEFRRIESI